MAGVGQDVTVAVRRYLVQQPDIQAKVGATDSEYWIFRLLLPQQMEMSGQSAIVINQRGSWQTPNRHNTMKFPRLEFSVYADPQRQAGVGPVALDPSTRIIELCDILRLHLHRPDTSAFFWDNLRVLNCTALDDADPRVVEDADGLAVSRLSFGATLG